MTDALMRSSGFLLLAAALAVTSPLAAQRTGTLEVGGFARRTMFDDAAGRDGLLGGGARLGIFFARYVGLEADVSWSDIDGAASYMPIHARLFANVPLGRFHGVLFGAGAVRNDWHNGPAPENGLSALAGVRIAIGPLFALRVDGSADYIATPSAAGAAHVHWAVQAGASLLFRSVHPDPDGDGVRVALDRCPDTPAGVAVDASGCPVVRTRDSDADGVPDLADRCEATAVGQAVDASGCPATTRRDLDLDGVEDGVDRCPMTRAGEEVDASGCPLDDDRDGVPNRADRCPDTEPGADVDILGCPQDRDGDRVPDARDRCPDTRFGDPVDESGCALPRDADGDGVVDERDRCPTTAAGAQTDHLGCPPLFSGASTLVLDVAFQTGAASLTAASLGVLDGVAEWLLAYPDVRVEIGGHTDARGGYARNLAVSRARAEAVRDYLEHRGVQRERMQPRGYGPQRPIATNATEEGRARNRRVELRRLQ